MVVELKETLAHTNISFANTISDHQEFDIKALNKIIDIIAEIVGLGYKPSDYVTVNLIPPIVLILQLIEMTLSSIGNITGIFQNIQLPFDPYYLLQTYVPHVDWNEFRKASDKKHLEDGTKQAMSGGGGQVDGPQQGGGMFQ